MAHSLGIKVNNNLITILNNSMLTNNQIAALQLDLQLAKLQIRRLKSEHLKAQKQIYDYEQMLIERNQKIIDLNAAAKHKLT